MKYYSNVIVTKLKEYSRSYGATEAVGHAYGIETDKEWLFLNDKGSHACTMRKGSKLLINVIGDPMPEDAFHKKMQELENAREQARRKALIKQEQERREAIELRDKTIEFIKCRVTREKAAEWVERFKEGNAQERNKKWIGKAVQIGLDRSDSRLLRDVCKEMAG